ncbi:mannose-1-phosphate guanylyltransferase/mannose-6-phosphate isomerase [Anaeroselena agilis]|uniref:mannose-1-phosphate guanylyltransferase n=1 Tax=Anaeroselena agilis TaxID=3063788 RepID=A0ABU3P493_9FIRM|nr:mannose-1-phosphate guanylyltransferase/mannose-6-phosphate isomerase [Selenomonadales bacterium 4137-cl]
MKIIILAGGGGTRLFPLSRANYPKQFLKLGGPHSLLAQTVARFLPLVAAKDIVIVTNHDHLHHVRAELSACSATAAHIILEPVGRNTAPAVALAARYCIDKLGADDNELLLVTPSDHLVGNPAAFVQAIRQASTAAGSRIVTFGVRPDKPETGYGYIQAGAKQGDAYIVDSFKEKPDAQTAERYLKAGNYYWNSGLFAFTVGTFADELSRHQPAIHAGLEQSYEALLERFADLPDISLDYAIAEKSDRIVTIPLDADWSDIGSWDAIYDVLPKDAAGNAIHGDCLPVSCRDSLILGHSRLIAGIGLEDILVVETDDVILVAKKGESQKVKEIVAELKARGRREAAEHTTVYRPWGRYSVLGEGPGYKLKKIVVNPGQRLSLQLHHHRSEHWIVIGGTAKVTIGAQEQMVHENESAFVPVSTKHRLENPGKIPLEMIEVQNGKYLEEDDIVRFDDIYGRA